MVAPKEEKKVSSMPEREAAFRRIAREMSEAIQSGELPAGSRLPTLDELAAAEGVGRSTMQHALRILQDRGLIRPEHGRGFFVRDLPS